MEVFGGLTAGTALRRAGIKVDLIEAKPDLGVYGVGIIQPNNTLRALDQIGLGGPMHRSGSSLSRFGASDNEVGSLLIEVSTRNRAAQNFPPVNGITRPALDTILTQAAVAHGVTIRVGVRIALLNQDRSLGSSSSE